MINFVAVEWEEKRNVERSKTQYKFITEITIYKSPENRCSIITENCYSMNKRTFRNKL